MSEMQWADDVRIETPEQIDVALELAGLGSRFVGWFLDLVFKTLLIGGILVLVFILAAVMGVNPKSLQFAIMAIGGLCFFLGVGYDIYFEVRRNGQSPGKKNAGTRVVREDGGPVDFGTSCIRNLLAIADFLPMLYLGGALLVLMSKKSQRLGDMAAGTLVIRERALRAPDDALAVIQSLATDEIVFTAEQLRACGPNDRHVLRSFFQRQRRLKERPRQQLAVKLAEEFARKMAYQPLLPFGSDGRPLNFLASLYRDLEKIDQHRL